VDQEKQAPPPKISIVTASYNCAMLLPQLIGSLRKQTDKNFQWVVADGASSDGTLELLQSVTDIDIIVSSQPDFGIYDALNRALKIAAGSYYIVAGADDCFYADAIANYRSAIEESAADIVAARVMYGHHCFDIKSGPSWLFGDKSFIAQHSLGTAFRLDLHTKFGLYSRKFPVAADSLFILQACKGGATRCKAGFVAGSIGRNGVSYLDWAGSATELFRVQLIVGCALIPQVLLLLLRIIKGSSAGVKTLHNALFRESRGAGWRDSH
jgi:glycosyltransferase involved in cell wall biosynthesis